MKVQTPHGSVTRVRSPMGSFGEDLRRECIARGFALEDISAVTKIGQRHWNSNEIRLLVIKTLCSCCSVSYANLNSLASLVAGIDRYQHIGVFIVDAVLE